MGNKKLKVSTLGLPMPRKDLDPHGCPIFKALTGAPDACPAVGEAIRGMCEIDDRNPDLALLPANLRHYRGYERALARATINTRGLPTLAFDLAAENPKPRWVTYLVRFSWYKTSPETGGIICPPILKGGRKLELPGNENPWEPLPKGPKPAVSFCGRTGSEPAKSLWRLLPRRLTRAMASHPLLGRTRGPRGICGAPLRKDALRMLAADPRITLDAIDRGPELNRPQNTGKTREQFAANLRGSPYSLCVRGSDNYSYRFYETLLAGRIPVLVDTGCILPLEDSIDWDRLIVRVPAADLDRLPQTIVDRHEALSEKDFRMLQEDILTAASRLNPENFFPAMIGKIRDEIKERSRIRHAWWMR